MPHRQVRCRWLLLAVLVTAAMSEHTGAATISCDPYHVILQGGETATSTVSWSDVGSSQTVEVYVSINNGTDQLLQQQQGPGSLTYRGISLPNLYVFKLYEGTGHSTMLNWVSLSTQHGPAAPFGYNYLPTTLGWFNNTNYSSKKTRLQQDLVHMKSLMGNTIRFNYWLTGCALDGTNDRWVFNQEFFDIVNNMVNWLSTTCYDNDVRVSIAFHNDWFVHGPNDGTGRKWWETYPGMTLNGFITGASQWMTYVVNAVEANANARQVVFGYDFQNEVALDASFPNIIPYLTYCYDHVPVPEGKYMLSFANKLQVANWPLTMGGRRLDYVDLHYYPDAQSSGDQPQQYAYWVNLARQSCPVAKIVMGEYGQVGGKTFGSDEGTFPSNEYNQSFKMIGLATGAVQNGVIAHVAWDFIPPATVTEPSYGMTYYDSGGGHKPKDVIGALSAFNQTLYNPDAEIATNGIPDGWTADGSKAFTFAQSGPDKADAATNSYYAKLTMAANSGTDWASINTPVIHNADMGGQKLYVNAYIRTNMKFKVGILEYDQNQVFIRSQFGTEVNNSVTTWQSYQHCITPWVPTLAANAHYLVVQVRGARKTTSSYLHVDAVSVFASGMDRIVSVPDTNPNWHQHIVARYSFDGNCQDSVGGRHATLVDYDGSATWQEGRLYLNNAASFDSGANKYRGVIASGDIARGAHVSLPSLLNGLKQATIEMWIETPIDYDDAFIYSFGGGVNGDGPTSGPELTLKAQSSSRLASHWNQSASWWGHDISGYPNPNGPAFYVLTIEEDVMGGFGTNPWDLGDRLRVFVDGTLRGEFTGPSWEGPGLLYDPINWYETANCLGKSWQYGYKANVILDEIRVYDVALTAEQIVSDYTGGPDAVGRFDFDGDGDVDFADMGLFNACASGPGVPHVTSCGDRDLDHDGDVDQTDFGLLQGCLSGEGNPAIPNCGS